MTTNEAWNKPAVISLSMEALPLAGTSLAASDYLHDMISIRPLPMMSQPTYVEIVPVYLRRKVALAQRKAYVA